MLKGIPQPPNVHNPIFNPVVPFNDPRELDLVEIDAMKKQIENTYETIRKRVIAERDSRNPSKTMAQEFAEELGNVLKDHASKAPEQQQ